MASAAGSFKGRDEYRKAAELEEARKAGLAPAAVDEDGKEINPHIPQYMAAAPWYLNNNGPVRPQCSRSARLGAVSPACALWLRNGVSCALRRVSLHPACSVELRSINPSVLTPFRMCTVAEAPEELARGRGWRDGVVRPRREDVPGEQVSQRRLRKVRAPLLRSAPAVAHPLVCGVAAAP